jgi:hypothetical protein
MRKLGLIALVVCAIGIAAPVANASSAPVRLSFEKVSTTPGVWTGTVAGDINGDLTTKLLDVQVTGPIWHVTFDWIVSAGASSFTARLTGTLNNNTGGVVMNGKVIDGYLFGAQVHEQGQLLYAATLEFAGSILLFPSTAD